MKKPPFPPLPPVPLSPPFPRVQGSRFKVQGSRFLPADGPILRDLRASAVNSPFVSFRALLWPFRDPRLRRSLFAVGCSVFLLPLTGCQVLTYTAPNGEH